MSTASEKFRTPKHQPAQTFFKTRAQVHFASGTVLLLRDSGAVASNRQHNKRRRNLGGLANSKQNPNL